MNTLNETLNNNDLTDDDILNLVSEIDFDETTDIIEKDIIDKCISCGKSDSLHSDISLGIIVCNSCGQVNDGMLDNSPEWKSYSNDDSRSDRGRCSIPINHFLPQSSLGTSIGGSKRTKIQTLHRWSQMPYKERSRYIVLNEIENKCRKSLILKKVEDDAKIIYHNISECKHVKGKNKGKNIIIRGINRLGLIGACVYYACRRNKKPLNPKEIADLFNIRQKDLTKGRRTLFKLMKIRNMGIELKSSTAEDFIPRLCKELRLKDYFLEQSLQLAKNIKLLNIASSHTQPSIATSCVLLMVNINNLNITKKYIANKFDVSEVTITKAYRCIEGYKDILLDDEKTEIIVNKINEERKQVKIPESLKRKYDLINSLSDSDDSDIEEEFEYEEIDTKIMCDIEYDNVLSYTNNIDIDIYNELYETDHKYNVVLKECLFITNN